MGKFVEIPVGNSSRVTDHLGNNRLGFDIFSSAAREIQHDDYNPFGKTYNSYVSGSRNNYLHNGKELQGGLEQYDYGARFDPVIGRWNLADTMAEKFYAVNPYNYTENNPINNIDPDGRETWYGDEARAIFTQLQSELAKRGPEIFHHAEGLLKRYGLDHLPYMPYKK